MGDVIVDLENYEPTPASSSRLAQHCFSARALRWQNSLFLPPIRCSLRVCFTSARASAFSLCERFVLVKAQKPRFHRQTFPGSEGPSSPEGCWGPALLLLRLMTMSASTASLLLNLEAVATAAIAWIVYHENVDKRVGAGFALIVFGSVLLSLPQEGGFALSRGGLPITAACLCWRLDNNLTCKISGRDPSQIAMWKGLVAGTVVLVQMLLSVCLCLASRLADVKRPGPPPKFPERWLLFRLVV